MLRLACKFFAFERWLPATSPRFLWQGYIAGVGDVSPGIESAWDVQCGEWSEDDLPTWLLLKNKCLLTHIHPRAQPEARIHAARTPHIFSIILWTYTAIHV